MTATMPGSCEWCGNPKIADYVVAPDAKVLPPIGAWPLVIPLCSRCLEKYLEQRDAEHPPGD